MELQSSLSISCSISLILIGLILHIDQSKVEKVKTLTNTQQEEDLPVLKKHTCDNNTSRQHVSAPEITEFFQDNDVSYLSPSLQLAFASDTACLTSNNTLVITPDQKFSLDYKDTRKSFERIYQRVDKILALNHGRTDGPLPLFFKIQITGTAEQEL
jgi:hypothetical protein